MAAKPEPKRGPGRPPTRPPGSRKRAWYCTDTEFEAAGVQAAADKLKISVEELVRRRMVGIKGKPNDN